MRIKSENSRKSKKGNFSRKKRKKKNFSLVLTAFYISLLLSFYSTLLNVGTGFCKGVNLYVLFSNGYPFLPFKIVNFQNSYI